MSALPSLQTVLQRPDVWRGDRLAALDKAAIPTGFAPLDEALPGGGWPRGALIELLAAQQGIGELSMLLPALRACAAEAPIVLVAPPGEVHAPAWAAQFPLARLLLVQAGRDDIAWSTELLLASGGVGAVLAWLPAQTDNKCLRRLQLAAEGRRGLAFLCRPRAAAQTASPAPLRLQLTGSAQGLRVDILKRRGPVCAQPLWLNVARPVALARQLSGDAPAPVKPHLVAQG